MVGPALRAEDCETRYAHTMANFFPDLPLSIVTVHLPRFLVSWYVLFTRVVQLPVTSEQHPPGCFQDSVVDVDEAVWNLT